MSKQRDLIALDWLMPVLQDVFAELNRLLQSHKDSPDWQAIGQHLHQITGALTLANLPKLAKLAKIIDKATIAIAHNYLPAQNLSQIYQAVVLLQFELVQSQAKQQIHHDWVNDRIDYFEGLLGLTTQSTPHHIDHELPLLPLLPIPTSTHDWHSDTVKDLIKLWRYSSLQLLQQQKNAEEPLANLAQVADYLATSKIDTPWRQVWHLVAVWCGCLAINEQPLPSHYSQILANLSALFNSDFDSPPDSNTVRLALDIVLQLHSLTHTTEDANAILATLDISGEQAFDTLFSQVLDKLEKIIYQVSEPLAILPLLTSIKTSLANRGWVFYENQLAQIINDVRLMSQDSSMVAMLSWQVERQLQDLYSQLLTTVRTLDSQLGLTHFAYAADPQKEAVRQTRVHLENIKLSYNQYIQVHDLNVLTVNDDLLAIIQLFGALGFNRPKELTEQVRLLFNRMHKQSVTLLSWEATDAIADMIARFELFLDYLSNQTINDELLDQTQTQLNRANLLLNRLIETPLQRIDIASRQKLFQADTLIYDDEGEHTATQSANTSDTPVVNSQMNATSEQPADSEALLDIQATLPTDDYSMDEEIREIFIEEAEEVLADMATQISTWQLDVKEFVSLKEIRRGFHTLKGSGRMVGANQIGEMCWAVENMLNRVLDGTLPVSEDLVSFIKATHHQLPVLVEDFAKQRLPSIDPAITILKANNLLSQQPINTGLSTDEVTTVASDVTPIHPQSTQQSTQPTQTDTDKLDIDIATTTSLATMQLPASIQTAYDAIEPVTDTASDPDIQEIYVEEAEEVIETITALNKTWQSHPEDFETLKEIRRGFHTLKGSGRMVGANQLGELAWSIENMLNRVLDYSVTPNAGLLVLVNDVIEAFAELIAIFANNSQQYPPIIKLWQAIANVYAKKQGDSFDYATVLAMYLGNDSTTSTTQTANHEPVSQTIELANMVAADEIDAIETEQQDITAMLFLEEAQELLATIDGFISQHQAQPATYISDALVRAFHTLRGGAALIELKSVYDLSCALEDTLGEMLRKELPLSNVQLEVLNEAKNQLQSYVDYYQTHQHDVADTEAENLPKKIEDIIERLTSHEELDHESAQLSVEQLMALNIDDLLDADQYAEEIFTSDSKTIVDFVSRLEQQAEKLAQATAGLSYFVIPSTLQFAYHKLAQYPQFAQNKDIYYALMILHNQLINMFDAIAAGLKVNINDDSINELKQLLAKNQYQAQLEAIEYQPVTTEDELLQIFLEETKAIQPEVENNFNQWLNNLSNPAVIKALRNQFHTFKGGADLVGIHSMAALAQRGGRLYDAIETGQLASSTDIAVILQKLYATIAAQLKQVQQHHRSFFANDFISQLDAILAGQISPNNLQLAVPVIVDAKPEDAQDATTATDTTADIPALINDPLYIQDIINNFEQRRLETWQGQQPDEDILNVYLEEAKELIDSSSQHLQEFRSNTNDIAALQALQRELHTIKGGARMVGAEGIANLSHEMETIYEELGSRRKPATKMIGTLLAACHDWLASSIYVLENKFNPQTPVLLIQALQQFSANPDSLKTIPNASLASQIEQIDIYKSGLGQKAAETTQRDLTLMPSMEGNFAIEQEQTNLNAEMMRISSSTMERMINLSGESAINRSRIEMGVSSLTHNIEEMEVTVQRLADQLRRMETELEIQILAQIADEHRLDSEFDPLEMDQYSSLNQLSKSLSESASDLLDIKTTMLEKTRETENLLLQLSRTQAELQEGLMDSKTVPFSRITPRLQRVVRQIAAELGKTVELRILNDEDEIDRNILERITSPLEHMLRNSVDHGIEKTQERIENGKSRTGLITLEVQREGGEIVIHLSDDGRGINVNAVRQKAIEQGLISDKDTSLKPLDIMQYIFNAGLSTAKSVSQISGRGVGMDVVQMEVKQLGGVVLVDSEAGKGSRFTMRLPLTVAVSDALMVRAGDKYFAVPLVQIERVMRINVEALANFYTTGANSISIDGQEYRLRYLNQILFGSDPIEAIQHQANSVPVIIIRTELGQRMALQVDMIAGSRVEVVVKPLGRQLSHIAGISAATIMGDGSVMMILDLVALMRNVSQSHKVDQRKATGKIKEARKPVILIVDDSVTVRKVTSRLLERHGYEAQIATDGVDALEKLQDMTPDAMVLDIEMPRMDGFEVANHVRHNARLKNVPIIMITSRTGEKHRERAFGIGVNEYMGKPFQEQVLLDTLKDLTEKSKN